MQIADLLIAVPRIPAIRVKWELRKTTQLNVWPQFGNTEYEQLYCIVLHDILFVLYLIRSNVLPLADKEQFSRTEGHIDNSKRFTADTQNSATVYWTT